MATTIAKQLYVTIQYRKDASTESGLLGFASPYTKDAAFLKRKSTQDSWAYGSGATVTIADDDSITVSSSGEQRGGYGRGEVWDATMLFMANCYPKIVDNEPIDGFQIAKSVRRYGGWGGSGNVVWRLADPRGFELEIGSENFARIVDCTTIVNGVIQGKCVWGRDGGKNILLPESSEPYQEAVKMTIKTNTKISLKDVQVGDTVEILSTKVVAEDLTCQYLGKYYFLSPEAYSNDRGYNTTGQITFNTSQTEQYLFKSIGTGKYFVLATPKVISIVNKIASPLDKMQVAKDITAWLSIRNSITNADHAMLVSPTKINLATVTMSLTPISDIYGDTWPFADTYGYRADTIVVRLPDSTNWIATQAGNYDKRTPTLTKIEIEPTLCQLRIVKNKTTVKASSSSSSSVGISNSILTPSSSIMSLMAVISIRRC